MAGVMAVTTMRHSIKHEVDSVNVCRMGKRRIDLVIKYL